MATPLANLQPGPEEHQPRWTPWLPPVLTVEENWLRMVEEGTTWGFPRSLGELTERCDHDWNPVLCSPAPGALGRLNTAQRSCSLSCKPTGTQRVTSEETHTARAPQRPGICQQKTFLSGGTGSPDTSHHITSLSQTCGISQRPQNQARGDSDSQQYRARVRGSVHSMSLTGRYRPRPVIQVTKPQHP